MFDVQHWSLVSMFYTLSRFLNFKTLEKFRVIAVLHRRFGDCISFSHTNSMINIWPSFYPNFKLGDQFGDQLHEQPKYRFWDFSRYRTFCGQQWNTHKFLIFRASKSLPQAWFTTAASSTNAIQYRKQISLPFTRIVQGIVIVTKSDRIDAYNVECCFEIS